jgi:hypothetical protein
MYILCTILAAILLALAAIRTRAVPLPPSTPLPASVPLSTVIAARNRLSRRGDTNIKVCIRDTCARNKFSHGECEDFESELEGWMSDTIDLGAHVNFTTDDDVCTSDTDIEEKEKGWETEEEEKSL